MIIVTGTKRSGTSMWMQILRAAGIPIVGEPFSKNWKETIYEANPHGFYESPLRRGIYYQTNPDPRTGAYLPPDAARGAAVKVFIPGLCRTDMAYITRVVGTMRHWREYGRSLGRLLEMEDEALREKLGRQRPPRPKLDPLLEWWLENYLLVRDIATRQYPARLISYARIVDEGDRWIPAMMRWLGTGDIEAATAVVDPTVRTQFEASAPTDENQADGPPLDNDQVAAFDALYAVAHDGAPIDSALIDQLNRVHLRLVGAIEQQTNRVRREALRRRAVAAKASASGSVATELGDTSPDLPSSPPSPRAPGSEPLPEPPPPRRRAARRVIPAFDVDAIDLLANPPEAEPDDADPTPT